MAGELGQMNSGFSVHITKTVTLPVMFLSIKMSSSAGLVVQVADGQTRSFKRETHLIATKLSSGQKEGD